MPRITEAKNVKVGDYIDVPGTNDIREVYKITCANRMEDLHTGKLRYMHRRFYFGNETGADHDVEHRADALIVAY